MLIAEIICLVDLMYFVAAYLVPDIGNKDLVLSGGRQAPHMLFECGEILLSSYSKFITKFYSCERNVSQF